MLANQDERLEELLSHLAEDELTPEERAEVEAFMQDNESARFDLGLEKALVVRLRELPGEVAPPDFARGVLEKAPALPGGVFHRIELTLRRLMAPSLAVAGGLAAALLIWSPGEVGLGSPPPVQVASLVAGPGGLILAGEQLYPDEQRPIALGQRLVIPEGSDASLIMGDGVEVEALGGSRFSVDDREVHLEDGRVHVRVEPGIGDFRVRGPLSTTEVIGTEFTVDVRGGVDRVAVIEGKVAVTATRGDGARQLLGAGEAGTVRRSNPKHVAKSSASETSPGGPGLTRTDGEHIPRLDSF